MGKSIDGFKATIDQLEATTAESIGLVLVYVGGQVITLMLTSDEKLCGCYVNDDKEPTFPFEKDSTNK